MLHGYDVAEEIVWRLNWAIEVLGRSLELLDSRLAFLHMTPENA